MYQVEYGSSLQRCDKCKELVAIKDIVATQYGEFCSEDCANEYEKGVNEVIEIYDDDSDLCDEYNDLEICEEE